MYDIIGENEFQLKMLDCIMRHYNIGDKIKICDGIYICYGGWFLVEDGILIKEGEKMWSKYGDEIDCSEIVEGFNPLAL